ncbi:flagellar biosynthesis protein FliP [Staphylococcus epidermidis]|nr:hypothetical protein SAMN04487862_11432 [Staphylococcus epidermidis]
MSKVITVFLTTILCVLYYLIISNLVPKQPLNSILIGIGIFVIIFLCSTIEKKWNNKN